MEMNIKTVKKSHTVNIFNKEKIEIVGATEVLSSTEKEIIAKIQDFSIIISGVNLSISKLVPEEELLVATGNIFGLKYESKLSKKSFLKKVFK